ncbi:MAG: alpha/beta hydrolase-fold protein [Roseburia sp.]|nr:alpha/beta hydrolase-fold protein [Roseburia sp.]
MKRNYEIAVISKGAFARTVRIFAPKKADRAIIMHDGQNVFRDEDASFKKSWRATEILKSVGITNTAVIGVDSIDATREDDYMPFPTELEKYGVPVSGGKADVYADYLEQTLIPYLDKRFGFGFYGMLGSSAGALATLHFAARKNARLKAYGMFSTPLFISPEAYSDFFKTATFDTNSYYNVYCGGSEVSGEFTAPEILNAIPQLFVDDAFTLTNALRKSGVKNLRLQMNNTSVHDELSWRAPEKVFMTDFAAL